MFPNNNGPGGNQSHVYQIDFTAVSSGKRIASSKRRVRWRFGFANPDTLAAGQTGTDCRGEEHEVSFIWSIASGKRLILADGQEVHYSVNRESNFQFSWTMRGNHVVQLTAHALAPQPSTNSHSPGHSNLNNNARQYDLKIDGQSVFQMPKVYQLGVKGAVDNNRRKPGHHQHQQQAARARGSNNYRTYNLTTGQYEGPEAPRSVNEEEAALQTAIAESLAQSKRHLESISYGTTAASSARSPVVAKKTANTAPALLAALPPPALPVVSAGAEDLLDLLAEPMDAPAFAGSTAPAIMAQDPVGNPFDQDFGAVAAAAPQGHDPFAIHIQQAPAAPSAADSILSVYGAAPVHDPFAPQHVAPAAAVVAESNPFDAPTTTVQPAVAPTATATTSVDPFALSPQPAQQQQYIPQQQLQTNFAMPAEAAPVQAPAPAQPTNFFNTPPLQPAPVPSVVVFEQQVADPNVDLISQGLNSLVNLTDLSSPVAGGGNNNEQYNPFDLSSNSNSYSNINTSIGIDPNAPKPSLGEIQKTKAVSSSSNPKESIMKSPPGAAANGTTTTTSMVLHAGQQQGNFSGYGTANSNYGPPPLIQQQQGFSVGGAMYGGQQQQQQQISPMMAPPLYGQQQHAPTSMNNMNAGGNMYASPPAVHQQQQQYAYPPQQQY